MAHKKAGGSSRNGRDSQSKRLGTKRSGGQQVLAGLEIDKFRGKTVIREYPLQFRFIGSGQADTFELDQVIPGVDGDQSIRIFFPQPGEAFRLGRPVQVIGYQQKLGVSQQVGQDLFDPVIG